MKAKEFTLKALNKIYREDPWVRQLYNAAGIYADDISDVLDAVYNNYFFDTMDLKTVERYEREMNVVPPVTQSIEERRKSIESKWKSSGKATIALMQSVADSWYKGGMIIDFIDGKLIYEVQNSYMLLNFKAIVDRLNEKKPAHLGYFFRMLVSADNEFFVGGIVTHGNTVIIGANLDVTLDIDDSALIEGGVIWSSRTNIIN